MTANAKTNKAYQAAGVDLEASDKTLTLIKDAVKSTYNPRVLAGLGSFGGLFDLSHLPDITEPVLVASTDSVGTKTMLAVKMKTYTSIGFDIVNHCINDILVQNARPLFFLDYIAAAKLEPDQTAAVIKGVAAACKATGTVLIGGETAEMPGIYRDAEFDLVGTVIGIADKANLITGSTIQDGDHVLALMSGGLQTNGFSLARKALELILDEPFEAHSIGLELLKPHRHYLEPVNALVKSIPVKGMAHITGGGITGNLPRIFPKGLGATITLETWPIPEIFLKIQEYGQVAELEMYDVFNMGAGFLIVVSKEHVEAAQSVCPEPLYNIGVIHPGEGIKLR